MIGKLFGKAGIRFWAGIGLVRPRDDQTDKMGRLNHVEPYTTDWMVLKPCK